LNWLLAIAFLALFWLLMESGQMFFAFLVLIVLFLMIIASAKETKHAGAYAAEDGGPVIVTSKPTKFPKTVKIAVKPSWGGRASFEDFASGAGAVLLFPLKMIVGFFRRSKD
jgi:hypothetical protein